MAGLDFQALFDSSPNPYMVLDRELRFVAANPAYARATGVAREKLLGKKLFELFPHDSQDRRNRNALLLRESLERVLATGRTDTLALISYRIDGHERFWSATHVPIFEDGQVAFVMQHTVDVSDLKSSLHPAQLQAGVLQRAQRVQQENLSLDAERRYLRRLFELAPAFIAVTHGKEHTFAICNAAFDQLVGHRPIIGKPIREALPELEGQGFFELMDRVHRSGEPYVGRGAMVMLTRTPGAEPEARHVDFVYQPVLDAEGSVAGIFIQGQDVTATTRAEEELVRYRDHLEELVRERTQALAQSEAALRQAQKMEAVGNLTGGVAHDFNNLLQVIGGNLQLLQPLVVGEAAQRRLTSALRAVSRGARLASHLLAFARRQPLSPRPVDLGKLASRMDELLRRTLGDQIELETRVESGLWMTFADPNQLENVILNLAINARDAITGPGNLKISLSNASRGGDFVLLEIADNGSGMTQDVKERAFEPFFTTKPEGRGTGLGLSMVHGFVHQSGGHIEIESEVGRGTALKIYLPRSLELAEPEGSNAAQGTLLRAAGETLLVVEDDAEVLATVAETLRDLGYTVLCAPEAQSALEILKRGTPVDLLFTDVVMPGAMRGPDLAKAAREIVPGLEVLFTSGYPEDAIVHDGRLDAGVELLSKPYSREALAQRLRELLQGHRAAGSAAGAASRKEGLEVLVVEDDGDILEATLELLAILGHRAEGSENAAKARQMLAAKAYDLLLTDVGLPDASGVELASEALRKQPALRVILASGRSRDEMQGTVQGAVVLPKPYDLVELERALGRVKTAPTLAT